jgi:reactive intermediate/imine deaminase
MSSAWSAAWREKKRIAEHPLSARILGTPCHHIGAAMSRQIVSTDRAPKAIGPYSQAVRAGNTVYLSGQVALDPATGELVSGGFEAETRRVFENLKAVAAAAGSTLDDAVRVTIYLTDIGKFPIVNGIMAEYFQEPYPARVTIGVASLPKGAAVEVDCVLVS